MGKDNSSNETDLLMSSLYKDIAHAKYNAGKYEEAIIACKKSREIDPKDSYPLYLEGCIHFKKEDYPLGIKFFSQALQIIKLSTYYLMRGNCKFELEDFKGAIEDFNKSIELDPKDEYIFYKRASCYFELEDYKIAIDDLNKSIEIDQNDVNTALRGESKFELNNYESAIEDFNKALDLDPEDDYIFYKRASCYFELGDFESAIDDVNKSIEIDQNDVNTALRGTIKFKLMDYEGAIEDFNKAIELNPEDDYSFYYRSECKFQIYDYIGAIEDINKSISMDERENKEVLLERKELFEKVRDLQGFQKNLMQKFYYVEIKGYNTVI